MWTHNQIAMDAPPDTVFRLAAEVEFWPALLPHYRSVRVLRRGRDCRLISMSAWRDWIPVSWTSLQWPEPERRRITFRHVRGVTRGMVVEWSIEPRASDGVIVTIAHHWTPSAPLIGEPVAQGLIGPLFVECIADKTLRSIKSLAEGGSPSGAR